MTFEEYLASKKIDTIAYQVAEPHQWEEFKAIFRQMHPKSFTMQKLNLINGLRRRFSLAEELIQKEEIKSKTARPVLKPKVAQSSIVSSDNHSAKPVMKLKVSMGKPKMAKPVVKPKIKTDQSEKNKPVGKVKPIIKELNKGISKPKMVRPVIKPKPKN